MGRNDEYFIKECVRPICMAYLSEICEQYWSK